MCRHATPDTAGSLPLMGIGNLYGQMLIGNALNDSLPLMGIGNQKRSRRGRENCLLITPHGDRKPSATGSRE